MKNLNKKKNCPELFTVSRAIEDKIKKKQLVFKSSRDDDYIKNLAPRNRNLRQKRRVVPVIPSFSR